MSPLTPKQKKVLDFIEEFSAREGYPPSQQEIAAAFGFRSLGTVQNYLVRLEREGVLSRDWNARRGMRLVRPKEAGLELPLVGTVAAGRPIEAVETPESVAIPPDFMGRGETFVLRVKGNSMVGDGILDGDLIVVEKRRRLENGALAVVLLHGADATVKRFYQEGDTVRLKPSNSALEEIVFPAAGVEVRGVVVGLLRRYRRV